MAILCPLIGSFQICQTSNGIVKIDGEKAEIDIRHVSDIVIAVRLSSIIKLSDQQVIKQLKLVGK